MRNRIWMCGGIAALVIGLAVFAVGNALPRLHAQERGGHPRKHFPGPEMAEHLARVLDLTDAQQTQIKAILETAKTGDEPRRSKMDEVHQQLEAATANGQFDEAQVRGLANQQAQLMADSIVEHERMKSKIYALLTPEQRAKADELHKHGGPHRRSGRPPF
ncbi:MAG: Spy/CpxP family protein refolding chaperone [Pyrinomonadaceae bacterium]